MASIVLPKIGGHSAPFGVVCATMVTSLGESVYSGDWTFSGGILNESFITCESKVYTIQKSGNYRFSTAEGHGDYLYNPVWTGIPTDGYLEAGATFTVKLHMSKGTAWDSGLAVFTAIYDG